MPNVSDVKANMRKEIKVFGSKLSHSNSVFSNSFSKGLKTEWKSWKVDENYDFSVKKTSKTRKKRFQPQLSPISEEFEKEPDSPVLHKNKKRKRGLSIMSSSEVNKKLNENILFDKFEDHKDAENETSTPEHEAENLSPPQRFIKRKLRNKSIPIPSKTVFESNDQKEFTSVNDQFEIQSYAPVDCANVIYDVEELRKEIEFRNGMVFIPLKLVKKLDGFNLRKIVQK